MMKTVFMFSGQGSQHTGMGKELYDNFKAARDTFDEAGEALNFDVKKLCFEDNEDLNKTEFAQPALLTAGIAACRILEEHGIHADIMMGLSLGEYTALTAADAFKFPDAVKLVRKRGSLMAEAAGNGGMTAVMGLDRTTVGQICANSAELTSKYSACANFNTPNQTVIAGDLSALEKCEALIKEAGGKAVRLNVSGPFHSKLLKGAAEKFTEELKTIDINEPKVPIIANLTGDFFQISDYQNTLAKQMISPVQWVYSVEKAILSGGDTFVELGAGKTLCSFVRQINKNVRAYPCTGMKALDEIISKTGGDSSCK